MAKHSILVKDLDFCIVCGSPNVEIHHCIYGTANRKWSDKYGLIVPLCGSHHRGSDLSPHFNRGFDLELKKYAQERFEEKYPELDFVSIFGKNYLDERKEKGHE